MWADYSYNGCTPEEEERQKYKPIPKPEYNHNIWKRWVELDKKTPKRGKKMLINNNEQVYVIKDNLDEVLTILVSSDTNGCKNAIKSAKNKSFNEYHEDRLNYDSIVDNIIELVVKEGYSCKEIYFTEIN